MKHPRSSIPSNVNFSSSWSHRKEEKKRQKRSKEKDFAWSKVENHHAVCDCTYTSVPDMFSGRNFCGYLTLQFFPNRKILQNIVPAINGYNKVVNCAINFTPLCSCRTGARPLSFYAYGSLNHHTMRTQNYSKWSKHGRKKSFFPQDKNERLLFFAGNLIHGLSRVVLCSSAFE